MKRGNLLYFVQEQRQKNNLAYGRPRFFIALWKKIGKMSVLKEKNVLKYLTFRNQEANKAYWNTKS